MTNINRREVIVRLSALLGVAFTQPLAAGVMGQKTYFGPSATVTPEQQALLAEATDVIIPNTSTPGAKEAGVEKFITRVVRDCYEKKDQDSFYAGLDRLNKRSKDKFGTAFTSASAEQKKQVMQNTLESDAEFFQHLKSLTVTGYFTSEIGATQALDYLPVPGRFEGAIPLTPQQKTWAL
jgi:hypothetical protein